MKARLLPYMEQTAIYNAINFSFRFNYSRTIARPRPRSINTFLCPSDGNNPGYTVATTYDRQPSRYGQSNYGNNIGVCRSFNGGSFDGPAW